MWFFKQAQQAVPTSTEKFEPTEHKVVPTEQKQKPIERKFESAAEHTIPVADWFTDVIRPIERGKEHISEADIEHLMDKNGWWKQE